MQKGRSTLWLESSLDQSTYRHQSERVWVEKTPDDRRLLEREEQEYDVGAQENSLGLLKHR